MYDFFCFKQKTAYELRISDWSSDVCSSDLLSLHRRTEQWPDRAGKARKEGVGQERDWRTAQKILAHAPSPILLVPVEAQAPDQSYQRILVPLDGDRKSVV